ncbi:hypothetical protein C5E02_02335 [Rathayibacter rathayi]|nr:hypothetical protein C5C34_15205 [Rathayibacter rathayi]PPF82077.1 hypothetical protein C5C14_03845 [Rathayibacter rathayi]PPG14804.1 hypothetical protein C5C11_04075 [Rathayibacter rathayi]PPG77047.1 hypothetical protein C5C15_10010 [Rathayibacter rathayi]PPG90190.1 hypothetical protein C5C22_15065 [Rathayibacter rathayi]
MSVNQIRSRPDAANGRRTLSSRAALICGSCGVSLRTRARSSAASTRAAQTHLRERPLALPRDRDNIPAELFRTWLGHCRHPSSGAPRSPHVRSQPNLRQSQALLDELRVTRPVGRPRSRPDRICGGAAYPPRAIRAHLRARGIESTIPGPRDQQGHRKWRGSLGGRPVTDDSVGYKKRNIFERGFYRLVQRLVLTTRYDKLAVLYRSAIVLNAFIV